MLASRKSVRYSVPPTSPQVGVPMDNWISQRIRAVSFRRVVVWMIGLVGGVLLATSDHRYIVNFLGGPYKLERADLDSIRDVTATPRYYARVAGDRVVDTGLRQYTVRTQAGVETSREEAAAYHATRLDAGLRAYGVLAQPGV